MSRTVLPAAWTLACLLMLSCASTGGESPSLEQELAEKDLLRGGPVDRIPDFNLNGWNYVDRKHIVVTVGASRRYLVELRSTCHGLTTAEVIGFTTTTDYLTRFDHLLVKDSASRILERCYIDGLYELASMRREE